MLEYVKKFIVIHLHVSLYTFRYATMAPIIHICSVNCSLTILQQFYIKYIVFKIGIHRRPFLLSFYNFELLSLCIPQYPGPHYLLVHLQLQLFIISKEYRNV